jgi:AcrR family transcriptional regulator
MSRAQNSAKPRELITDTAVRLFSEHGYAGTTMRDIAEAVGLLPGSLYAHIDSKETLLLEIVQDGIEQFLAIERQLKSSTGSAEERLRTAIKAHISVVAESPKRMLIVFHQWRFLSDPNRARVVAMRRRYAQAFKRIIEEGIKAGETRPGVNASLAVLSILGAINWVPEWYSSSGPVSPEELGEEFAHMLISGLWLPVSNRTRAAITYDRSRFT